MIDDIYFVFQLFEGKNTRWSRSTGCSKDRYFTSGGMPPMDPTQVTT